MNQGGKRVTQEPEFILIHGVTLSVCVCLFVVVVTITVLCSMLNQLIWQKNITRYIWVCFLHHLYR